MRIQISNFNLHNNFKYLKNNNQIKANRKLNYQYNQTNFTGISNPGKWLADIGKQNQTVKYYIGTNGIYYPESNYHIENKPAIINNNTKKQVSGLVKDEILPNKEVGQMLSDLDDCNKKEKEEMVKSFENLTGFFDFKKIKEKADKEIVSSVYKLLDMHDPLNHDDLKFIGYDRNCSLGRSLAMPGSDADALYIIVDDSKSDNKWITAQMRWELKDIVNQRILSTPANHLPEVLSVKFLEKGLKLADEAYSKADFSSEDLSQFEQNLHNSSKDFVKCGDFNIRLAELLPDDTQTRDEFYKTAMLVELIRNGEILINNLPKEFIKKVKASPLYKYSNLVRQEGLKDSEKYKYQTRKKLQKDYQKGNIDTKFAIIKELIKENYNSGSDKNNSMFSNTQENGLDAMGNINEMWDRIMYQVKN